MKRYMLQASLESVGHKATFYGDVTDALFFIKDVRPDMIIVDYDYIEKKFPAFFEDLADPQIASITKAAFSQRERGQLLHADNFTTILELPLTVQKVLEIV